MNAQSLDKEALRRLIEATVSGAGELDPAALPHEVRRKLQGRATGELDLDAYIQQVLREMKRT